MRISSSKTIRMPVKKTQMIQAFLSYPNPNNKQPHSDRFLVPSWYMNKEIVKL
jgi:hypothetical protein